MASAVTVRWEYEPEHRKMGDALNCEDRFGIATSACSVVAALTDLGSLMMRLVKGVGVPV